VNFSIVPAAKSHLSAIPRIEQAAASVFSEADLPLHIRFRVTDRKTLADAQRERRLWVAVNSKGEPVGFALACVIDEQAHLDEMDVLPDYARRGIGTKLVETVVKWADDEGFDELTLTTFRHLPWNAPYYAALGFEIVEACMQGDEMHELMRKEAKAGLKAANRVCMRRLLQGQS